MKLLLYLFNVIVLCQALTNDNVYIEWQKFQTLFGKNYKSPEEAESRFSIFKENLKKIKNHNTFHAAGNVTYELGLNQFSDWSSEEFSEYLNKFQLKQLDIHSKIHPITVDNGTIPEFLDWRLEGAVTAVKNQGHCGSCWAFSAAGALEGQAKLSLGELINLSEQNLLDCADDRYGNYGCDGGIMASAFAYVNENGIESGESYPYVSSAGKCRQKSAELYVNNYHFVENTEDALKKAVAAIGPISVGIESTAELQHYSKGVFFDKTCTDRINHGVLVVGYGVDDGQDYWLIKNSWGPSWGDQGYFKLARNRYNNCGVANCASYPIVEKRH